jgi:cytochrome c-type biogenesis protein
MQKRRLVLFFHALLFVLGFSLVFIVGWGGAATVFGQVFSDYKSILARIGGLVVILFGLATMGVVRIPWLYMDTRPDFASYNTGSRSRNGLLTSGLMGVFFAAGWTPCIGTTLGAILTLGFSQETSGQAMVLSSGYALGLGVPFLIIGLGMERVTQLLRRFQRSMRWVQLASGLFLILIGLLLVTNQMFQIAVWAQRNGFFLNPSFGAAAVPTYLIAILAGVLSFFSPCVLPLVPAYMGYLSSHAVQISPTSSPNININL